MVAAAVVATSAVRDWSFMAEKIVFHYIDDLDGSPLDVEDLHTVDWSWAGVDYHIDTSTTNLDKIEAGHISVATLLSKSVRADKPRSVSSDRHAVAMRGSGLTNSSEVRRWALANHHRGVGMRGRLSKTVVQAYIRAH
jgi:hypothetical protein